jgi:hypothetical protein
MAWTKIKTAMAVSAVVILAAGTTTTLMVAHAHRSAPLVAPGLVNAHIPLAAWTFAGYATPEAAFQSGLWAMSKGDVKTLKASLSPAYLKHFVENDTKGKSESEIGAHLMRNATEIEAFQVVSNEIVSDHASLLHVHSTRRGNAIVSMQKVNDEWKMDSEPKSDDSPRAR